MRHVTAAAGGAVDIHPIPVTKIPRYPFRRIYGVKFVWKSM